MQGCPLEETGLVEQQADDDHGDEGGRGIPDNGPHQGNIAERDHTCQQCQARTQGCAPAYAQAFGLPDDQNQSD